MGRRGVPDRGSGGVVDVKRNEGPDSAQLAEVAAGAVMCSIVATFVLVLLGRVLG